jgi:aspartate racemase
MHVGLIGGIGVAATEFYYRGLIARHEKSGIALDLTIVHADVNELTQNAAKGEARKRRRISPSSLRGLRQPVPARRPSRQ